MTTERFKMGDRVQWASQAAGIWRTKVGVVVEVVAPGTAPATHGDFGSRLRDHESYVVRAVALGRRSGQRTAPYWPRVPALYADVPTPAAADPE